MPSVKKLSAIRHRISLLLDDPALVESLITRELLGDEDEKSGFSTTPPRSVHCLPNYMLLTLQTYWNRCLPKRDRRYGA